MYYMTEYSSPIGALTLASDSGRLVGLWIEGQKYFCQTVPQAAKLDTPVLEQAKRWLDRYFAGKKPASSELPLAPAGSGFRQAVWKLLCEIPYGQVTTYGELAEKLAAARGRRTSARAVGGAVGHNPISIIIPCHRVAGADGSLTGYAGGLDKKIQLLEHEGLRKPAQSELVF